MLRFIAVLALLSSTARADVLPPPSPRELAASSPRPTLTFATPRRGSLALPRGDLSFALTLEIESSADKLAEPITVAPDVAYGATDQLTLSVVHSKFATTGFRAATGGGVCLGDACAHVYNNVGAEALYAWRDGPLAVASIAGIHAVDLDAGFYDVKLGGRVRYTQGRVALTTSPSLLIAATHRVDAMDARLNKDLYFVPVLATYKLTRGLTAGPSSGIKGALHDLGGTWEVPFGALATYAFDRHVTVGASFVFGKLLGGADVTGAEFRGTQAWIVVTP